MYLRIALELYLKRCVVGGFERVFEMGRVFRNEGLDTRHNPEFTMLEAYQALADYHDMMDLVEAIVVNAARDATGTTVIHIGDQEVDLGKPWKRISMADLIEERNGVKMHPTMDLEEARAICDRLHVPYESSWGAGRLMSEVYDETCEATLIEPTFVYDYPREVSPLARTHRDDPTMTERFECVVAGRELANAYSELNDPVDQRAPLRGRGEGQGGGRRGGRGRRRGLHPRARVRPAAHRWAGNRDRPHGHAAHRRPGDPRRPALPHHAPRGRDGRAGLPHGPLVGGGPERGRPGRGGGRGSGARARRGGRRRARAGRHPPPARARGAGDRVADRPGRAALPPARAAGPARAHGRRPGLLRRPVDPHHRPRRVRRHRLRADPRGDRVGPAQAPGLAGGAPGVLPRRRHARLQGTAPDRRAVLAGDDRGAPVVARRLPRPLRSGVPARPRPLRADLLRRRARVRHHDDARPAGGHQWHAHRRRDAPDDLRRPDRPARALRRTRASSSPTSSPPRCSPWGSPGW